MLFLGGKNNELVRGCAIAWRRAPTARSTRWPPRCATRSPRSSARLARQHVVQDDFVDQDVFGLYREGDVVEVVVLFVRAGKLVGRRPSRCASRSCPTTR